MSSNELALDLPLGGVQLIEASAGTGKTYTLATLYLRLVIEARLDVARILAVTYTRAATAELRERLRLRLQQALQRAESDADIGNDDGVDALLRSALQHEPIGALRTRLRQAVAAMDVAPIHTIHAFCQRALADFALEAGQPLAARELLGNERELHLEVATEYWREVSRTPSGMRALSGLASSPLKLSQQLRELLAVDALEPPPPQAQPDVEPVRTAACDALAEALVQHADTARALLHQASISGAVHRTYSKDAAVDAVWQTLQDWLQHRDDAALHKNTWWFGSEHLRQRWSAAKGPLPRSPLFDSIDAWRSATAACEEQHRREQLAVLHRLRAFGQRRLAQLKRERAVTGFDDLVDDTAAALSGDNGAAFAARLQAQYQVALVDEFQDTDLRQSAIFERLFAQPAHGDDERQAARALFLIGDPKQAIYRFRGGDVVAYLTAAHRADQRHALQFNYRSRPLALKALEALYRHAGDDAFAYPDISFQPVGAGGGCSDEDFLMDSRPAAALTLIKVADASVDTAIERVRMLAAEACASTVLELLQASRQGRVQRRRKDAEVGPVQPGDIAVLVEQHDDASLLRTAFEGVGIPCAVSGRDNILLVPQAEEILRLLQALRAPADEALLRAALATPLLGFDAASVLALDENEDLARQWQERAQQWRQRMDRAGPLAVLTRLVASASSRLRHCAGGERALSNYLQLGEVLQQLAVAGPGVDALLDAFERRIDLADHQNEDELLRLESDADRVAIRTLHASKGLEFEFVFLPLIATHGGGRRAGKPELIRSHDGERRLLHVAGGDEQRDTQLRALAADEDRAERLRLLYVGLTRARLATWVMLADAKKFDATALAWLLHPQARGETGSQAAARDADLRQLAGAAPDAIAVRDAPAPAVQPYRAEPTAPVPPARVAARVLARDWWVYSYSMLAGDARDSTAQATTVAAPVGDHRADDEIGLSDAALISAGPRSRLSGARFGNALHAVLERTDFVRWHDWTDALPPPADAALLDSALREQGYGSEADLDEGRQLLTTLIAATLNVRLPEGLRLCELSPQARRDELEFHLSLVSTSVADVLSLLHAHDVVVGRAAFGVRRRIEGLLTGRIDLVYMHEQRFYLLDYKSNLLDDYRPAALADAVQASEYDLQYVIYTLALHRWLRFRIGGDYDYDRHIGGIRYLFCRGLDPLRDDGSGIHALRPPRALIESLDRLFAGGLKDVA